MVTIEDGVLYLPGGFFLEIRLVLVLAFVLIAAAFDVRSHRIPNWLVLAGAAMGVAWQVFEPALIDSGLAGALEGMGVGFALLLPLYLLHAMGAGDVKLMAMVGTYLGPRGAAHAALLSLIAGGVLALIVTLAKGKLGALMASIRQMFFGTLVNALTTGKTRVVAPAASVGKMPYGVAIALGTIAHVVMTQRGSALF